MPVDVLLGLQWGDEGKGKIVDVIAPNYEIIARFQGGPNAGHTIEFDNHKHVLHIIPSGIFRKEIINVIGNGVVIDPVVLRKEIEALEKFEVDIYKNLIISKKAHLILPTHKVLDAASEKSKGKQKIGSTLKGIGPTYMDKTGRNGIRVGDVFEKDFKKKYKKLVEKHQRLIDFHQYEYDTTAIEKEWFESIEFIKKLNIQDTEIYLNQALKENKNILAEGAQGTLLDIDFGTYPYVTSSNTTASGVCVGLGVPPTSIRKVIGIFKAYCTRVGSGPFPTELDDEIGTVLQERGNEFGSTTGRSRRCGWLDLPALKYACMINGVTELAMMKADVFDTLEDIKIATHYEIDGEKIDLLPHQIENIDNISYHTLSGWQKDITNTKSINEIPTNFFMYISFLEKELDTAISILSVGPNREQTFHRKD